MKKIVSFIIALVIVVSALASVSVFADNDYCDLRPNNGTDSKYTVSGGEIETDGNGTAYITLTESVATVEMIYKDESGTYVENYIDIINNDSYVKYFYAITEGITKVEIHGIYERGDKDNADLYLSGMQASATYFKLSGAEYGVWDIGTYLKDREAKGYVPTDGIIKFDAITYTITGNVGDIFTLYYFEIDSTYDEDFGTVIPEEIIIDESSEEAEESKEESKETSKEEKIIPVGTVEKNIASNATYEVHDFFRMSTVTWSYDESYPIVYGDNEAGNKLTDGIHAESASYTDSAWIGMSCLHPNTVDGGVPQHIIFKLDDNYDVTKCIITVSNLNDAGISAPSKIVAYTSTDGGATWSAEGIEGAYATELVDGESAQYGIDIYEEVNAIKFEYTAASWAFTDEIEIYAHTDDAEPVVPRTGDAGVIALAVISVVALAGAVIVKKSK